MIATMLKLQEVPKEAINNEVIVSMASAMYHSKNELSEIEFARALFDYSSTLSALTVTLSAHALLTESELNVMLDTIREFDELGDEIQNGI